MADLDEDAQNELDTDLLILEYLVYNATSDLLTWHAVRQKGSDATASSADISQINNHTDMVDSFLDIFRTTHTAYTAPATLKFSLQLLRFVTLFTCRSLHAGREHTGSADATQAKTSHTESIVNGGDSRHDQAGSRNDLDDVLDGVVPSCIPSPTALLRLRQRNRERAIRWQILRHASMGAEDEAERALEVLNNIDDRSIGADGTSGSMKTTGGDGYTEVTRVLLLDLIPSFIQLTYSRATLIDGHVDGKDDENRSEERGRRNEDDMLDDDEDEDNGEDAENAHWTTSPQWLSLATQMMSQASLEAVSTQVPNTDPPSHPNSATTEAFSWGPLRPADDLTLSSDISFDGQTTAEAVQQSRLFLQPGEEIHDAEWWKRRRVAQEGIKNHINAEQAAAAAAAERSDDRTSKISSEFETAMCGFLKHLLQASPKPVLAQLEGDGRVIVDGLEISEEEEERLRGIVRGM